MTDRRSALLAGLTLATAPAIPLSAAAAAAGGRIVANEYWTEKNGVKLWVYRKRAEGVAAG